MRVRLNLPSCMECVYECSSIALDNDHLLLKIVEQPGSYKYIRCRSAAEARGLFEEACEQGYVDLRGFAGE